MGLLDYLDQPSSGGLPGIVAGVVTDNSDAEKKGLLQVRVLMLEEGEDLLDEVRVLQPYAGKSAGMYFLPEIGDLVLVALVNSGLGRAFVLGSFYPQGGGFADGCFYEENNRKTITTRGGAHITISDEDGKESITISTPKKQRLTICDETETIELSGEDQKTSLLLDLKNGKTVLKAGQKMELLCGDSSIRLDQSGKITMEGTSSIELAGGNIQVKAKSKAKVSAQDFEAAGQISAKISGQSQLELSSGGITQVKGGIVKLNG